MQVLKHARSTTAGGRAAAGAGEAAAGGAAGEGGVSQSAAGLDEGTLCSANGRLQPTVLLRARVQGLLLVRRQRHGYANAPLSIAALEVLPKPARTLAIAFESDRLSKKKNGSSSDQRREEGDETGAGAPLACRAGCPPNKQPIAAPAPKPSLAFPLFALPPCP